MKHSKLVLALSLLTIGAVSCTSPADKVEKAKSDVDEAKKELAVAKEEYMSDIEIFREETAVKIELNEEKIHDLKTKSYGKSAAEKADFKKKIAKLEERNEELEKTMNNYKGEGQGQQKWELFKTEFNHDMEELGEAFKDITVDNVD